jgi:glycosyltransferase involved in cell wall biosynthesis
MNLAITFTNFGPYHLARLRALGTALAARGDALRAYELAGSEDRYPWKAERGAVPFDWVTLFPNRSMESLPKAACREEMTRRLDRDQPDALAVVGYSRPESLAMLRWGGKHRKPSILMSESQRIDHPRVWWKETIKRGRIRRFDAALVGGPRHRDYLAGLGMPRNRVIFGYNAVDNDAFAARAAAARRNPNGREGITARPYFLSVSRFAPEKNLVRLVEAYARYRSRAGESRAWDLVLCGGGETEGEIRKRIDNHNLTGHVHLPGFLQAGELGRWYGFASAFVHASLLEPWGLDGNEAAACGLPLLISDRAGCVDPLVPEPPGITGRRFDASKTDEIAGALFWLASQSGEARGRMGANALKIVAGLSPEQFALGTIQALAIAVESAGRRSRTATLAGVRS